MPSIKEVLAYLDNLRDNLSNYTLEQQEDIANSCQDIIEDINENLLDD